ncbi:hypothetical protein [Nitratireductor indicus]|uniref:hypothetical protein n=1 Tax=Nitratireductor indicus TaxID=721133 RepID=UPI0008EACF5A|nr:hypothetical protein [Nitratireductor indicus]SFQ12176.1 hypothetical protein SAMN05216176_101445 [Nitratireductor indicus]
MQRSSVTTHLRHHSTIVFNRERTLVSPGAAWRFQQRRKDAVRRREREAERRMAWSNNPDNPTLSARRRAELAFVNSRVADQPDR